MDRVEAALPDNLKSWVYLMFAAAFLLAVFLLIMAGAQHQNDEQFITSDVLKTSVQSLESYTAEATLLQRYTLQNAAPRAYTQTYSADLQDATDAITLKLTEHAHDDSINRQVRHTIALSQQLSRQLDDLGSQPRSQLSSTDTLEHLTSKLQQVENVL